MNPMTEENKKVLSSAVKELRRRNWSDQTEEEKYRLVSYEVVLKEVAVWEAKGIDVRLGPDGGLVLLPSNRKTTDDDPWS